MWVKTRFYADARVRGLRCYIIYSKTIIRYFAPRYLRRRRSQRLNFGHGKVLMTERASTHPRRAWRIP